MDPRGLENRAKGQKSDLIPLNLDMEKHRLGKQHAGEKLETLVCVCVCVYVCVACS